ncbi:MAG: aspartate kinase [Candidatus Kapaibacterium sp.]
MIVIKFGGSSIGSAGAMKQAVSVLSEIPGKKFVVLSACKGITDLLLSLAFHASISAADEVENILNLINKKHYSIIDELSLEFPGFKDGISEKISEMFLDISTQARGLMLLRECGPAHRDKIVSFGEYLSTAIFYHLIITLNLNAGMIDSAGFLITDSNFGNARVNGNASSNELKEAANNYEITIAQGFIGKDEKGRITTTGRGGSDYSAAIFGRMLKADEIQIWKDVPGILTANPALVNDARAVSNMSFNEMRELAHMGAEVLHPEAIMPAIEAGIPVRVKNTFAPENQGTLITSEPSVTGYKSIIEPKHCFELKKSECDIDPRDVGREASKLGFRLLNASMNFFGMCLILISDNDPEGKIDYLAEKYGFEFERVYIISLIGQNSGINKDASSLLIGKAPLMVYSGQDNVSLNFVYDSPRTDLLVNAHELIVNDEC